MTTAEASLMTSTNRAARLMRINKVKGGDGGMRDPRQCRQSSMAKGGNESDAEAGERGSRLEHKKSFNDCLVWV